ncbi:hypothetical protein ES702_01560 [subsurface metagenome]
MIGGILALVFVCVLAVVAVGQRAKEDCDAIFKSQEELDAHIENEHSPPPPPPKLEIPVLGDYTNQGVRHGITGRTMIPQLMSALKQMGVRDYMHNVWKYSHMWDDFKLLAPECQKAGIRLWLYNVPPSEPPAPKPFEQDYIRWAREVALLMVKYPVIQGMLMDDFNGNTSYFTIAKCQQIIDAGRAIAPNFKFIPVAYMGHDSIYRLEPHIQAGVCDALLLVYWWPWKDPLKTDALRPQIEEYRAWIDRHSPNRRVPFLPFIVAWRGGGRKEPTPAYVQKALQICMTAYKDGLIEGMATYVLPKDNPEFIEAMASVYKEI